MVGSALSAKLARSGNTVHVLTRDVGKARGKLPYPNVKFFGPREWEQGISTSDVVVNLAGEPISTRCDPPASIRVDYIALCYRKP